MNLKARPEFTAYKTQAGVTSVYRHVLKSFVECQAFMRREADRHAARGYVVTELHTNHSDTIITEFKHNDERKSFSILIKATEARVLS